MSRRFFDDELRKLQSLTAGQVAKVRTPEELRKMFQESLRDAMLKETVDEPDVVLAADAKATGLPASPPKPNLSISEATRQGVPLYTLKASTLQGRNANEPMSPFGWQALWPYALRALYLIEVASYYRPLKQELVDATGVGLEGVCRAATAGIPDAELQLFFTNREYPTAKSWIPKTSIPSGGSLGLLLGVLPYGANVAQLYFLAQEMFKSRRTTVYKGGLQRPGRKGAPEEEIRFLVGTDPDWIPSACARIGPLYLRLRAEATNGENNPLRAPRLNREPITRTEKANAWAEFQKETRLDYACAGPWNPDEVDFIYAHSCYQWSLEDANVALFKLMETSSTQNQYLSLLTYVLFGDPDPKALRDAPSDSELLKICREFANGSSAIRDRFDFLRNRALKMAQEPAEQKGPRELILPPPPPAPIASYLPNVIPPPSTRSNQLTSTASVISRNSAVPTILQTRAGGAKTPSMSGSRTSRGAKVYRPPRSGTKMIKQSSHKKRISPNDPGIWAGYHY